MHMEQEKLTELRKLDPGLVRAILEASPMVDVDTSKLDEKIKNMCIEHKRKKNKRKIIIGIGVVVILVIISLVVLGLTRNGFSNEKTNTNKAAQNKTL